MRKNVKNEKVIRAMAIGISAMLMASSPLTALAAEGEEGTVPDDEKRYVDKKSEGVCDAAQAAADAADDAVERAEDPAATVKTDVEDSVVAGEAGTVKDENGDDKDLAKAVIDAATKVEDNTVAGGSSLNDAQTDIYNAGIQLDVAEANDKLYDAALKEAETQAGEAGTIASEMKDAMDKANKEVDVQRENIENATSVEDANAAYKELEDTANQAQEDFKTKLTEYNTAKGAYEEAAAKVKEYEEAYNKALKDAGTNAGAAAAELEAAKKNAADLEAAVAAAKDAVDKSAEGAMKIVEAEKVATEDGVLNWRNEDALFVAIMENYYLPEKLSINGATVTRVQGKDNNEYNYFKAVYKENGEEKVKYFNFKMDNGSKDDIVIFEKREVEIFGDPNETPDQYVKENDPKSVVDVAAGLENGTVVDAGGKYYEYESKEDKTLVSDSEVTGTSKEDVSINENTKSESWQYDAETGKLVKTVTADVTIITYTDATFTSDKSYATDAERDEAAAKKEAELEEATGKDATVNETEETTYTYTASGTYIPTFTKTVNVNKEYESGKLWFEADSKNEAEDKAYDWAKDKIDDDLGDYYLIGSIKSDLSVSMTEEETKKILGGRVTVVTDDSDYLVTGTVTATYAKVTKQTVNQSTFGALWDDIKALLGSGESTNEKLEAAAKEAIEADGGIFLSANWDDWSFNKATIRYVAGVKVTTDEKQTEQDAKAVVKDAALAQAQANGATGVYNVKTTGTDDIAHTTYSYTVDYLEKASENTEGQTIATETYGKAYALTGEIIQNKNYKDGNILLKQSDDDYKNFMETARKLTDKYDRLLKEAEAANAAVVAAETEVQNLKDAIDDLKTKEGVRAKDFEELKANLKVAEDQKKAAEEKNKEIQDKLKEAEKELNDVITRLTPAPTPGAPTGGEEDTDGTDTTVTPPVVLATAPTTPVNVVAPVQAAQPGVVEIEDDVTPLAPSVEENVQEEVTQGETEAEEPETEETIQIDDEVSPLADIVVEDEQTKMSWWWLLIVLLLGTTGYEMYKKHNEKKQKVQAENAEDAE